LEVPWISSKEEDYIYWKACSWMIHKLARRLCIWEGTGNPFEGLPGFKGLFLGQYMIFVEDYM
jgi:hypothetical protein